MDIVEKSKVQQLYSKAGYFDRFYEIMYETDYTSYKEVWCILEDEYELIFGQPRYTTYQSFKNAKQKDTILRQFKTKSNQRLPQ